MKTVQIQKMKKMMFNGALLIFAFFAIVGCAMNSPVMCIDADVDEIHIGVGSVNCEVVK